MPPSIPFVKNRIIATTTSRHYCACLLGALLLLFVANARVARYDMQRRDLKLATTQSYLDSDETWLELSMAALLLSWCGAHLGLRVFFAPTALRIAVAIPVVSPRGEFDRELRLRAPPFR
jgi:hypothetical protein